MRWDDDEERDEDYKMSDYEFYVNVVVVILIVAGVMFLLWQGLRPVK